MVSGIIGVPLGSIAAQKLRVRNPRADPLICAFGLLASTPLMFAAAIMAQYNTSACFVLIFFAELFLNLNWSIVADILLVRKLFCLVESILLARKHILIDILFDNFLEI